VATTRPLSELLRPSGWLLRASSDVGHALNIGAVADAPVDPTTLDLLVRLRLSKNGALRGVDLCNELHKSPSHLSRLIDRAEAAGLVIRTPDPNDRRAQMIAATPAGEATIDQYLPKIEAVLERVIFDSLSGDEIDLLSSLLSKVSNAARDEIGRHSS
jgi:DNA-binding MarR family transcriptional regulator